MRRGRWRLLVQRLPFRVQPVLQQLLGRLPALEVIVGVITGRRVVVVKSTVTGNEVIAIEDMIGIHRLDMSQYLVPISSESRLMVCLTAKDGEIENDLGVLEGGDIDVTILLLASAR